MARVIKNKKDHRITVKADEGRATVCLIPGGPRRAYLWIGDSEDRYLFTISGKVALLRLALAILRELGEGGKT